MKAGKQTQQRRFAGAVGAEQTENAPGFERSVTSLSAIKRLR